MSSCSHSVRIRSQNFVTTAAAEGFCKENPEIGDRVALGGGPARFFESILEAKNTSGTVARDDINLNHEVQETDKCALSVLQDRKSI